MDYTQSSKFTLKGHLKPPMTKHKYQKLGESRTSCKQNTDIISPEVVVAKVLVAY